MGLFVVYPIPQDVVSLKLNETAWYFLFTSFTTEGLPVRKLVNRFNILLVN